MLRSKLTSARRRLRVYWNLMVDVARFPFRRRGDALVSVDLHDPRFNKRYTYLFLKFLVIGGFSVALRYRERLVLRFNELKNTELVFSEDRIYLLPFAVGDRAAVSISDRPGSDKRIHMDYFRDRSAEGRYTLPIPMHPFHYHDGSWADGPPGTERVASVVFAGNVHGPTYHEPRHLRRFGMRSRIEQIEAIRRASAVDVDESLPGPPRSGRVYLLDKRDLPIGTEGWRAFLARFRFFLALPGQVMPLCHNAVEAMSVGTVPIMHERYAGLFRPELRHRDEVLTYGREDLGETLERALGMEEEEFAEISERALGYYRAHLAPDVVARRMMADDVREICMCGEGDSVRLMIGKDFGEEL